MNKLFAGVIPALAREVVSQFPAVDTSDRSPAGNRLAEPRPPLAVRTRCRVRLIRQRASDSRLTIGPQHYRYWKLRRLGS